MKRFTLSLILVALLVGACAAGASPTSAPTTIPTASPAAPIKATPTTAPSPTPQAVTAAASFDGKVCTYVGPTDLARGSQVTFSLVNTPAALRGSAGAALAIGAVVDGTTLEDAVKFSATHPATEAPPFALDPLDLAVLYPAEANKGHTVIAAMKANLYLVYAATSPTDTNKSYPCVLLKVFDR